MLKSFFLPIFIFVVLCAIYVYIAFILPPRLSKAENGAIAYGTDGVIELMYAFRSESMDILRDIKYISKDKNIKIQLLARQADRVTRRASELIEKINYGQDAIIDNTGGRTGTNEPSGWRQSVYIPRKKEYDDDLLHYCSFVSGLIRQRVRLKTPDTFSPLLITYYSLCAVQAEIAYIELIALNQILYQISADNIDFQYYKPLITVDGNPVGHRTVYQAYLSLIKTNPNLDIQLTCNEGEVKIENGIAKIRLTAKSDKFDAQGYAIKQLKGKLTLHYAGKDTTFSFIESYTVEKKNKFK